MEKDLSNSEEKTYPDCNSCGDYEYCAFHYDECTGYIPK